MLERRSVRTILFGLAVLASMVGWATEPPDLLNYQGVLRDASGAPLAGSFDMVFRFFDDPVVGTEILADQHVGAGAVAVSGGLFSAELGGGIIVPLTASSLAEVFSDHAAVYMQIDVEGEALAPRIRILSSGFALNSDSLDGRDATEFLDTSSNQVKTGDLTLDGSGGGGDLVVSNGGSILLDGGGFSLLQGPSPCDLKVQNGCKLQVRGGGTSNLEVIEGSKLMVTGTAQGLGGIDVTDGAVLMDGSAVTVSANRGAASLTVQDGATFGVTDGSVLMDGSLVTVSANRGAASLTVQDGATLGVTDGSVLMDGSLVTVKAKRGPASLSVVEGATLDVKDGGAVVVDGSLVTVKAKRGPASLSVVEGATLDVKDGGAVVVDGSLLTVKAKRGPASLSVVEGATLDVTDGGAVVVDGSLVTVKAKRGPASLRVVEGATLEVSGGGDVTMGTGSDMHVMSGSNLMVEAGGSLMVQNTGILHVLNGGLRVTDGSLFEVSGGSNLYVTGAGTNLQVGNQTSGPSTLKVVGEGNSVRIDTGGDLWVTGVGSDVQVSGGSNLAVSGPGNLSVGTGSGVIVSGPGGLIVDAQGGGPGPGGDVTLRGGSELLLEHAPLLLYNSGDTTPSFSLVPGSGPSEDVGLLLDDRLNVVGPGSIAFNTDLSVESGSDLWIRGDSSRFVLGNNGTPDLLVLRSETGAPGRNVMELQADLVIEGPLSNRDILIGPGIVAPGIDLDVRIGRGSLCLDNDGACVQSDSPMQNGRVRALAYDTGSSDLAELYPSPEILEPGDVVVLDPAAPGQVRKARATDDDGILSVISTAPGVVLGAPTDEELLALEAEGALIVDFGGVARVPGTYPVTLAGRVPVKVSDEGGPVLPGDFLTHSSTPGVAMKAKRPGLVLGQALQPWAGPGQGTVVAWIVPGASQFERGSAVDAGAGGSGATGSLEVSSTTQRDTLPTGTVQLSPPIDAEGRVHARSFRSDSAELAASVTVSEAVEPGDVLVADPDAPGSMRRGHSTADPAVVGIVSGEPGLLLGTGGVRAVDLIEGSTTAAQPEPGMEISFQQHSVAAVALSGIVPCKVDAGFGPIRVGDLLTTSPTPGHAMRAESLLPGTVVAKALEALDVGTGVVRVLVMLR